MRIARISICLLMLGVVASITPAHADDRDKIKNKIAPLRTAIPSLSIAPDARGGAMGDNGVSTIPDVNSQYWNPAKHAFQYSKAGVSLSYTPWLRKLVNDVALAYLSGYYKLGDNDNQAIGASLRYFSMGEVLQNSGEGNQSPSYMANPYEMAIDLSYSRKLSESFGMGVALRFIRSDMNAVDNTDIVPDNAFAADVSGYGEKYVIIGSGESLWSYGFNISNIGNKVSYDGGIRNQFLPAKLQLGTGILYPLDDFNRIGVYLDISKYLVPTEPVKVGEGAEADKQHSDAMEEYNDMSSIKGLFKSFSDSPDGFGGELKEIMLSLGVEYSYNDQFFLRGGYYYENEIMGNRNYFSFGAGFRMSVFQLDAAYLVSTVPTNPLDQTLRFSLSFDMDGLKNLFR